MTWSIKSKMSVMVGGFCLGLTLLAGMIYVNERQVEGAVAQEAALTHLQLLAEDVKISALTMTLAAMDAIIDKDEGVVTPERLAEIDASSKFLSKHVQELVSASEGEARQAAKAVAQGLPGLDTAIRTELVEVIRLHGERTASIESDFEALDDAINAYGADIDRVLEGLKASMTTRLMEADTYEARWIRNGLEHSTVLQLATARVVLSAVEAISHRESGAIAPEVQAVLDKNLAVLTGGMDRLEAFTGSPTEKNQVEKLKKELPGFAQIVSQDMPLLIEQSAVEVVRIREEFERLDGVIDESAETMLGNLDTVLEVFQAKATQGREELQNSLVTALVTGLSVFGVTLIILLPLAFWVMHSILRPLDKGVTFATAVAGGDLEQDLDVHGADEIGTLADALRAMVANLKGLIAEAEDKSRHAAEEATRAREATTQAEEARRQAENAKREGMLQAAGLLEEVTLRLTSSSEQLAAQVEQSSRGAEFQKERAGETATAMEEMNATVLEVARNASQAADAAQQAREEAAGGEDVVRQSVEAIAEVQRTANDLRSNMNALGEQAEGIGQIMNVISDIADQTNLLALNAAIEAARAGDAGRGFAVVADEVRKLAEKTMTATQEVGQAVSGIQGGARTSVEVTDNAVKAINRATELAAASGQVLTEIVRLVDESSDQVRSIATASEQQSAASEEINRSVEDVSRVSHETSAAMTQSEQAVYDLSEQAMRLKALVEDLKSA